MVFYWYKLSSFPRFFVLAFRQSDRPPLDWAMKRMCFRFYFAPRSPHAPGNFFYFFPLVDFSALLPYVLSYSFSLIFSTIARATFDLVSFFSAPLRCCVPLSVEVPKSERDLELLLSPLLFLPPPPFTESRTPLPSSYYPYCRRPPCGR